MRLVEVTILICENGVSGFHMRMVGDTGLLLILSDI